MTGTDKRVLKGLRDAWRNDLHAGVQAGSVIEFTEDDRRELYNLAYELQSRIEHKDGGLARVTLEIYKITKAAIARSHASS